MVHRGNDVMKEIWGCHVKKQTAFIYKESQFCKAGVWLSWRVATLGILHHSSEFMEVRLVAVASDHSAEQRKGSQSHLPRSHLFPPPDILKYRWGRAPPSPHPQGIYRRGEASINYKIKLIGIQLNLLHRHCPNPSAPCTFLNLSSLLCFWRWLYSPRGWILIG